MRLSNAADLQRVLAAEQQPKPDQLALGTVTSTVGTQAQVTFDEDLVETPALLTSLDSYASVLGDRVLMGRINGAWVILGRISTGPVNWLPLTMSTGWSSLAQPWNQAAYAVIGGMVCFKGVITKSTQITTLDIVAQPGAIAFGYLPLGRGLFTTMSSGASGVPIRLYIDPADQSLRLSNSVQPPVGANFGLECIRYPAEQ